MKKAIDHSKFLLLKGIGALVVVVCAPACLGEHVCGDKLVKYEEMCIMPSATDTQTDDSDSSDAGALDDGDAGESDSEGGEPPLPTGMDDPCTSSDECTGEADFCLPSNYPDAFSTTQDCDVALNDCPAGYECIDLSEYLASLPTACVSDAAISAQ